MRARRRVEGRATNGSRKKPAVTGTPATVAQPKAPKVYRDAAAKAMDVGDSAPDWLVQSETYGFTLKDSDWPALAASKVAFVTHCPANREYFARVHALGIRALPYVTFYQGVATASM